MPRRRNKRGGGKQNPSEVAAHEHEDFAHNRLDAYCCRLLHDAAQGILPLESDAIAAEEEESSLGTMLRQHLLAERMKKTDNSSSTAAVVVAAAPKKKRKKRRKKKTTVTAVSEGEERTKDIPDVVTSSSTNVDMVEEDDDEEGEPQPPRIPSDEHSAPPPAPSSSERSLLECYLDECWLSDQVATNNINTATTLTLADFLSYLSTTAAPFTLSDETVQQVIQRIACTPCLRDVQRAKQVMVPLCTSSSTRTANTATNRMGTVRQPSNDSYNEDAFYVAMEEATARTTTPGWYLVRQAPADCQTSAVWGLEYLGDNSDDYNNLLFWTLPHVRQLVEERILVPGLHVDQLVGLLGASRQQQQDDDWLSDNIVTSIRETVQSQCSLLNQEFKQMADDLMVASEKYQDTANHAAGGNIEMSSFPLLQEADQICCELLNRLLRTILTTTRSLQALTQEPQLNNSSRASAQHQLDDIASLLIDGLWRAYATSVQNILLELTTYDHAVAELANAAGAVTRPFCSATHRELYRQLVRTKIGQVHAALDAIREGLFDSEVQFHPTTVNGEGWTVSLHCFLVAHETCNQVVAGMQQRPHRQQRSGLDLAVEDALYELREWTETVHAGNVRQIREAHEQRSVKLQGLLQTVAAHVADSQGPSLQELSRQVGLFLVPPTEGADNNSVPAHETIRANVGNGITRTVAPWIRYKLEEQHVDQGDAVAGSSSPFLFNLPFKLRRVIVLDVAGHDDESPCNGGNGKTRYECILVGLLYRWMGERFQEWQAYRAEQELLTKLHDDEQDALEKLQKASHKKQKKKKGKKTTTVASDPPVPLESLSPSKDSTESDTDNGSKSSTREEDKEANTIMSAEPDANVGRETASVDTGGGDFVAQSSSEAQRASHRKQRKRKSKKSTTVAVAGDLSPSKDSTDSEADIGPKTAPQEGDKEANTAMSAASEVNGDRETADVGNVGADLRAKSSTEEQKASHKKQRKKKSKKTTSAVASDPPVLLESLCPSKDSTDSDTDNRSKTFLQEVDKEANATDSVPPEVNGGSESASVENEGANLRGKGSTEHVLPFTVAEPNFVPAKNTSHTSVQTIASKKTGPRKKEQNKSSTVGRNIGSEPKDLAVQPTGAPKQEGDRYIEAAAKKAMKTKTQPDERVDPAVRAGVTDRVGFQTAEEFLVERLVAVLRTGKHTAIIP